MAVVYTYVGILTVDVVFFRSLGVIHSQDSFTSKFRPRLWETSSGVVAVGVFAAEALTVDVIVFFRSPGIFHSQDSFRSMFRPRLWETSSGVVAVGVFTAEALRDL